MPRMKFSWPNTAPGAGGLRLQSRSVPGSIDDADAAVDVTNNDQEPGNDGDDDDDEEEGGAATAMAQRIHLSACDIRAIPQWLVGIGATLLLVQIGCHFSWSSPYTAQLQRPDSPIPIDESQASWIGSILNVGRLTGAIAGALCSQYWGSRRAALLTVVPFLLGWLAILLAESVACLYASRILSGIGVGMCYTCFPLFVGEVALPAIRGAIVTVAFVGCPVSGTITSILGSRLSLTDFSYCYLVPAVLALLLFLWLPDSPQYLIKTGRLEAAERSLRWYRGGEDISKELEDVKQYVSMASAASFWDKLAEFRTPYIRRAACLVTMLFVFMQANGSNCLLFFMESILDKAEFALFDPSLAVVYANALSVLFAVVAVVIIDRCGRKKLIILSSFGVALSASGLGTHFLLLGLGYDPQDLQYLLGASVVFFQSTFSIGVMTVPSTVQSEVFPPNIKNIASCICNIASASVGFLTLKSYQPLASWIGEAYVFYGYACIILLAIPYVLLFMPETKGKTLTEIQQKLMRKSGEGRQSEAR